MAQWPTNIGKRPQQAQPGVSPAQVRELQDALRRLEGEIQRMNQQMATDASKQRYAMDVLGMKRTWQQRAEDNIDATHPLVFDIYVPTSTKQIQKVLLRLRLKAFRAYETGAAAGGEQVVTSEAGGAALVTSEAGGAAVQTTGAHHWYSDPGYTSGFSVTSVDGAHTHGGAVSEDGGHTHAIENVNHDHSVNIPDHTHNVNLPDHTHDIQLPEHTHDLVFGMYEGPTPVDVTVTINGVDRTAELGGPFDTDQDEIDITQYITATGWNTIQIGGGTDPVNNPDGLGRIHATVYMEIYVP